MRVEVGQEDLTDLRARVGERPPELGRRRVVVNVHLVGERAVVDQHVAAVGEVRQPLERLAVAAEGERIAEPIGETRQRVAGLEPLDLEPRHLELVFADLPNLKVDPVLKIVMHAEQTVDEVLGSLRADDFEVLLARQPSGLQQGHQVGHVVEMVVGQQDRGDVLVADARLLEAVENAAPAVHEEAAVLAVVPPSLDEEAGLVALAGRHRASSAEKGNSHVRKRGPKRNNGFGNARTVSYSTPEYSSENEHMPSASPFSTLLALGAVGVGAWLLYRGLTLRKQRELMESTPTTDVWHLDVGPAEINGTAKTVEGETLRAPFTDESCLAAEWEIEEWSESGKHSSWKTVGSGTVSVSAFEVEDETGTLLVRPDGAEFDIDALAEETIEVGGSDEPPEAIREFLSLDSTPGASNQPLIEALDWGQQHGDRRYHQHLLKPGEEVYVYGTVHPRGDWAAPTNPDHMEIRKADERDEPMFLVSDRPESDLVRSRTFGVWRIPVGLLVALVGVWFLLAGLGVGF